MQIGETAIECGCRQALTPAGKPVRRWTPDVGMDCCIPEGSRGDHHKRVAGVAALSGIENAPDPSVGLGGVARSGMG